MKKIILNLSVLGFALNATAQSCVPDTTIKQPGHYPDQLPVGNAGQYYQETVQFNVPGDTSVQFGQSTVTANIDSIKVLAVKGLPAGLNYACNPLSCALPGGKTSCGVVFGTIDPGESGTYPFVIPVRIYAKISGTIPYQQPDTIYSLSMDVNAFTGEMRVVQNGLLAYPNPAGNELFIALPFSAHSAELKVFDSQGKGIELPLDREYNRMTLNTSSLSSGLYYGEVNDGKKVYRFHFVRN
ncbi:MAG: T9SS type A sorting domain-containing protein [Bacteroidia bacterium]